jgi:hypothetical protein
MTLLLEAKMSDQKMPKRPMSPRQKRYWLTTGGLGLVGGIFGYVMPAGKSDPSYVLLSNMPLSASQAVLACLIWSIGVGAGCFFYHRSIDEQEENAYLWACTASWYFIVFTYPVCWILARGGIMPTLDFQFIFVVSIIVNGVVWAWKKFF